jgi:hypothetical protein
VTLAGLVRAVARRLPPRLQGLAEYHLRPGVREQWGGAFNGQHGRRAMIRELVSALPLAAVVETGTFRGATTEFFWRHTPVPVHSVELSPRFYHYARRRLRSRPRVHLALGDSRAFLCDLAARPGFPAARVLFYLDAHWYDDLPLVEEIEIICGHWTEVAMVIDDFEVPGDPGYAVDDYGPGKRLSLELLGPLGARGLTAFFPALPSAGETGLRRGAVVLADEPAAAILARLPSLRR